MDDRYFNTKVLLDSVKKKRFREASFIPTIPKTSEDIYVITTIEDRLDLLAHRYYGNVLLWWIIASANPDIYFDSFFIEPGTQLRIPSEETVQTIGRLITEQNSNK